MITERISVLDFALEHIGDGFNSTMRVPGKAVLVFCRIVIAKIVHHQERVAKVLLCIAEYTMKMHAGSLEGGNGLTLR